VRSALDAEHNELIDQLIEIGREIVDYRRRLVPADSHDWHHALEPILDRHRVVVSRLRETAELRYPQNPPERDDCGSHSIEEPFSLASIR
jgi:hypothetical protein